MIRWSLLLALAAGLVAYAFWVYLRIELRVPRSRRLAMVRAVTLVLLLALLFDVRLPGGGVGASRERWVLLDASLSMSAVAPGGPSGWEEASARAAELVDEGWRIVTFGAGTAGVGAEVEPAAIATESLLSPALQRAAEAGVRTVRVLSDFRLQDQVAATAALA
ncbi:MAG TPA: hypothetical protein VLA09_12405, partial [Longimicrobiales bacterium]|nr:hypothetical protein [Longimicrobiales bacterium]